MALPVAEKTARSGAPTSFNSARVIPSTKENTINPNMLVPSTVLTLTSRSSNAEFEIKRGVKLYIEGIHSEFALLATFSKKLSSQ